MPRTFEPPEGLVGPKKGGYRFKYPYLYRETRWGKLRYRAMYFSRSQNPSMMQSFRMQDMGYMTFLEQGTVMVPAYKNVRGKNGKIISKRDGFQPLTAWIVYARKITARTA